MLTARIYCPRCGAAVASARPLPENQRIQCPTCQARFVPVPTGLPAGPPASAEATAIRVASHPTLPGADVPTAGRHNTGLILAFGGLLLFVGAGAGLIWWCLSGTSAPEASPDQFPADAATQRITPATVPKPVQRVQRPLVTLPPEQQAKVNEAIRNGVAYLRKTQNPVTGAWPGAPLGCTALPGLTLLECGVAPKDPAVQRAAAYLRAHCSRLNTTYNLALTILFLDRLDDPRDQPLIRELAFRLVGGQLATGGWSYRCPLLAPPDQRMLDAVLRQNESKLALAPLELQPTDYSALGPGGAKTLSRAVGKLPVLRVAPGSLSQPLTGASGDNSNTQFAILALWAARRHDVPLKRTLALLAQRFRTSQSSAGGWAYHYVTGKNKPQAGTPSMTCAGLLGMAVGLGLTNEAKAQNRKAGQNPLTNPQVQKGLAFLGQRIGNPNRVWQKARPNDLYLLWSLERVAVIYRLPKVNGKDWYGWGAEILTAHQAADGSWTYRGYGSVGTSLALLFLKRANLAKDLTNKLQLSDEEN